MNTTKSQQLQQRAEQLLPGGVDSPVRSFRAVGGVPRWIARAEGPWLWDVDGNRYLDCIGSWGAALAGHTHPAVVEALRAAAGRGASYGASTPDEVAVAQAVRERMPGVEMLRFVNSGTEATMSAVRAARGFTGREGVIKFDGSYHGHADLFLSNAGSGVATLGLASSAGVPVGAIVNTHTVAYNDLAAVERLLREQAGKIACVIVEPVAGNMGCVPPTAEFLPGLRELATRHQAVLIFDEVMTGFRVAAGGASERYGIRPDLVTLGKILGGGLPVGAYGGKAEIMRCIAPLGPVYQAGTLSGNPLAMAAGKATLEVLAGMPGVPDIYATLERHGAELEAAVNEAIRSRGVAACMQRVGSMMTLFFASGPVGNFADAKRCDTAAFARFHAALLEQGVMWPPSQFEAAFLSMAHDEERLGELAVAIASALRTI